MMLIKFYQVNIIEVTMVKYIRRFNKWYDKVEEPYRFLLAMSLAIVPITLVAFDRQVIGGTCLLVLISIRVIK